MKTEETLSRQDLQLVTKVDRAFNNYDAIEEHLNSGGVSPLSDVQEKLLQRWEFADELMRQNVGRLKKNEVANRLALYFNVSKNAALIDIVNAEKLFSTSLPLNKKYRIGLRIENLENKIRLCDAENDHFSSKNYEATLQKYYDMYPETRVVESPKTLIFRFDVEKLQESFVPNEPRESILDNAVAKFSALNSEELDFEDSDNDSQEGKDER